ncbi:MAG: TPM domain-containing protein [Asticcacaulis sp.]|nr:TPM domain-containing protein [Asticcacaulis sp.]
MVSRRHPVWLQSFVAAALVLLLALAPSVRADDLKFPDLAGHRVVDQANILSAETEADLELKLKGVEDATTDQVVVVTVDSLQGREIEDYGYQLGRHWGIGHKGDVQAPNGQTYKDNGLILLVAPNDRKVRIEVGYGLEPVMTDAMSSLIIREDILPKFKAGDYDGGVESGTDAVIQQLSLDRGVAIQKAQAVERQPVQQHQRGLPIGVIILIIVVFVLFSRGWLPWFILGNVLGGGGRGWGGGGGGDWGGGGGGGGFSGGGGSFGGGGSSGSW